MELAGTSLHLSGSLPLPSSIIPSRATLRPLSLSICFSWLPNPSTKIKGCRWRKSSLPAVSGSTTTGPSCSTYEKSSPPDFGGRETGEDPNDAEDDDRMAPVCDKLIGVFMVDMPTSKDWRRLLAYSREWDSMRPHFFNRCQERADSEEDYDMKHRLLKFARKLREVDEDVQRHNELLGVIKGVLEEELAKIVARRRKDFTEEFFLHVSDVANSYHDNLTEQNAIRKLVQDCVAAVEAYDIAAQNMEKLNAARLKLQDIINSPSAEAACRKIDNLAQKNQLDSAMVCMLSKAWSDAKETHVTKDEVKDILFHLYKTAVINMQRKLPKEIRIAKYFTRINDREELLCALKDAFTPGEEIEGEFVDTLYTTPEKLHTCIRNVVDAYHSSPKGTLLREARDLMNPRIIKRLENLKKVIEDNFM